MAQLNIRMNQADVHRFDDYARNLGLDRTGLANLLLRRELRTGGLSKINAARIKRRDAQRPRNDKVTAHLAPSQLLAFSKRAKELGLSRSAAGALILLGELQDEWLERALDK